MSDEWKFRPIGAADDDFLYVGHGADCVMLCEHGDIPRWRNAIVMSPEEAIRLGEELIVQARRTSEDTTKGDNT